MRRTDRILMLAWCATCLPVASAVRSQPTDSPCAVVVVGAPGTPEYGAEFARWARTWEDAIRAGGARVVRVGPGAEPTGQTEGTKREGDAGDGPGKGDGVAPGEVADRQRLQDALDAEARAPKAALWLVLIGHGTFDGQAAKFNLRGPDVSAVELAGWLSRCERPVIAINCASASGPFINALSGPNRITVTATKSGDEQNYARFGGYLAEAVAARKADLDKDGSTSLLEAFLAAAARTAEFYEEEARLATEHPLIDDNGDGLGTPAEWFRGIRTTRRAGGGEIPRNGPRANQVFFVPGGSDGDLPADLRERRDALELAMERLREEKASLDPEAYYEKLEVILLELARLHEGVQ